MSLPLSLDFGGPISSYQPTVFTAAESMSAVLSPTDSVLAPKKFEKKQKKLLTIRGKGAIIIKHLSSAQKLQNLREWWNW